MRLLAPLFVAALLTAPCVVAPAHAQPQAEAPAPYGAPITLVQAETLLRAALAEARATNTYVAIAVVDSGGHLVAFARMDGVGTMINDVAVGKARTAAGMRQPSADLEGWASRSSGPLAIPGVMPFKGGLPIVVAGRIIGGVGVSGAASEDDERVGLAGLAALQQ